MSGDQVDLGAWLDTRQVEIEREHRFGQGVIVTCCRCDLPEPCEDRARELAAIEGLRAAVAELKQLRAERAKLTALADELQVATAQNRAAMTEWLDLRFGMSEDAVALVATDGRLIGTQARRSEARQAWMGAAAWCATLDERFAPTKRADCIVTGPTAPQQPERGGEAPCNPECREAHAGQPH